MSIIREVIGDPHISRRLRANGLAPSALFLTATIAPPRAAVARHDTEVRRKDYLRSLEFYLSLPSDIIDRILFVDNSASDISDILRFVKLRARDKVIEIISFQGNDHPVGFGKAYGEFKLLDFGLKHTSLIGETDSFWKVTGRLRVLNLSKLVSQLGSIHDVACDLHNFPLVGTGKVFRNHWMDLRLFGCSKAAYTDVFGGKYETFGSRLNQVVLYEVVMEARSRVDILPRFPLQPKFSGSSGRHDREYDYGLQKLKTAIRSEARKYTPNIWL